MNAGRLLVRIVAALCGLPALGLAQESVSCDCESESARRPNILIIMVDDVGPEQIACYDRETGFPETMLEPGINQYDRPYPYALTPNITSLALDGVRFTRAFASPLCSTTRAQIQTGRYPFRTQVGEPIPTNGLRGTVDLQTCETTIPELLLENETGYEDLGVFGKWHLSRDHDLSWGPGVPWHCEGGLCGDSHATMTGIGWPFYQGVMRNPGDRPWPASSAENANTGDYFDWYRTTSDPGNRYPASHPAAAQCMACGDLCEDASPNYPCAAIPEHPGCASGTPVIDFPCREQLDEYITTRQRKDVQDWILNLEDGRTDGDEKPWLAFWNLTALHGPLEWPSGEDRRLHSYGAERANISNTWYAAQAMLEAVDTEIGLLKRALDRTDPNDPQAPTVWDETLVIFLGDNGTQFVPLEDSLNSVDGITNPYNVAGVSIPKYTPSAASHPLSTFDTRFKGSPYMGGSQVPLIVSGPACYFETAEGESNKGRTSGVLVDCVDLFDTIRELACLPESVHSPRQVDGVSFLPVLRASDMNALANFPRTQSLSMLFRPNGCFPPTNTCEGQGGTNGLVEITYGLTQAFDAASGCPGMYRIVRSYRVDPGCEESRNYLEFYQVAKLDGAGRFDNSDWLELDPIDIGVHMRTPGSPQRIAFESMICSLDALLGSSRDYCAEDCFDYGGPPIEVDVSFLSDGLMTSCP